jgi:hypothetical protein
VEVIRFRVFPVIPILIIAAFAFRGDRAMEYGLTQREVTGVNVSLLVLLSLVLPVFLQRKHKNSKGGLKEPNGKQAAAPAAAG